MAIDLVPVEFNLGGVYMPPLLVAGIAGIALAIVTARIMEHYRLNRHFFYPPLVTIALAFIYAFTFESILSAL
jgi:hypothetical protein